MFCSAKLGLQTLRSLAAESADWKARDLDDHPVLKRAMIEQGYGDMLAELKMNEVMGSFRELLEKTGEKTEEAREKCCLTVVFIDVSVVRFSFCWRASRV